MITFKTNLNIAEEKELIDYINILTDLYGDFYVTKNNLRLFIKDNVDVILQDVKHGDYAIYSKDGVCFVVGYSDNSKRKYLKILVNSISSVEKFLKVIDWNIKEELFVKLKKNNPVINILLKNGFEFLGGRGREILLVKKGTVNAK
jgi:hypothetical protein